MSLQEIKARIGLDGAPAFAAQGKAAADSLGDIARQLQRISLSGDDLAKLTGTLGSIDAGVRASADAIQQLAGRMATVADSADRAGVGLRGLFAGGLGVAGIVGLTGKFTELATELLQTQVRAETLQSSLRFAVGPDTGREMAYLRRVTNELGLEFNGTAKAYASFAAAARETRLEGDGARQVFESVAKASAVMGLSVDNTQGVLLALQQMMSKGTVQAEELRGQLGERLPGAFQIAARAMGVTTAELGKMLETGKVLSEDFLPKFAAQLNKELGDGAAAAANRTEASINRLSNAWENFKRSEAEWSAPIVVKGLNSVTAALDMYVERVNAAKAAGDGVFQQRVSGIAQFSEVAGLFRGLERYIRGFTENLGEAEQKLVALKGRLETEPGNILLRSSIRDTEELIAKLQSAQIEVRKVADPALLRSVDNRTLAANDRYDAEKAREQKAAEAALVDIRNKAIGVNKEWVASLTSLDDAQRRGLITEAERISIAQKLTAEQFKSSKASSDTFERMQAEIIKTIALNESRAQAGGQLSKAQELEINLNTKLTESLRGLSKAQAERIRALIGAAVASVESADAAERERKSAEQLARARSDARQAEGKAIDAYLDQVKREREAVLKSVRDRVDGLEAEAEAARLTAGTNRTLAEGIEMVAIARAKEKLERYQEGSEPYLDVEREIEARERLLNLMADKRVREANTKAAEDAAKEWERTVDGVRDGLTDAFRRAFESGEDFGTAFAKTIGNELKTQLASALAASFANGVINLAIGAAGGASGGGGSNWLGLANNASTLKSTYDLYTGANGIVNKGANVAAGYFANYGSTAGYASSAQNLQFLVANGMTEAEAASLLGGAAESYTTAGGLSSSSSAWGSAGAYAGYAALIYAAAMYGSSLYDKGYTGSDKLQGEWYYDASVEKQKTKLLKSLGLSDKWSEILGGSVRMNHMFEKLGILSTPHAGGYVSVSADGTVRDITQAQGGIQQAEVQQLLTEFTGGIVDTFNTITDAFGIGRIGSARSILESDNRDPSWGIFQVQDMAGNRIGGFDALGTLPSNPNEALSAFQGQTAEAIAQTLVSFDLPTWVDKQITALLDSADFKGLESGGEKMTALLATLAGIEAYQQALVDLGTTVQPMGGAFAQIAGLGSEATNALVDLAGGLDVFGQRTTSYLQNYYTDDERKAVIRDQLNNALADVNLVLPTTRDAFRDLVEAQDLTTESGRKAFSALMGVADAFAAITDAGRSAAEIANERASLQDQFDQLTGNQAAIDARAREKIDPSNRDLFDEIQRYKAQQAADAASAQALAEQEAAALAAQQAAYAASESWKATEASAANAAAAAAIGRAQVMATLTEEVARLRGATATPGQNRAQLEGLFALTTSRARKGDIDAARQLPGLSQQLEQIGVAQAASTEEANLIRFGLAASLERTVRGTGATSVPDELRALKAATLSAAAESQALLQEVSNRVRDGNELWGRLTNGGVAMPTTAP